MLATLPGSAPCGRNALSHHRWTTRCTAEQAVNSITCEMRSGGAVGRVKPALGGPAVSIGGNMPGRSSPISSLRCGEAFGKGSGGEVMSRSPRSRRDQADGYSLAPYRFADGL